MSVDEVRVRAMRMDNEALTDKHSVKYIERVAKGLIAAARTKGVSWYMAADNLEYFIDAKDYPSVKDIPRNWLRSFERVRRKEREFQKFYEQEICDAVIKNKSTLTAKTKGLITYYGAGFSYEELFFASGDSTLLSYGSFKIDIIETNVKVRGTVNYEWKDRYDWHAGKGVNIPFVGRIEDSALNKLVAEGNAAEYDMRCVWKQQITAEFKKGDSRESINWRWNITI